MDIDLELPESLLTDARDELLSDADVTLEWLADCKGGKQNPRGDDMTALTKDQLLALVFTGDHKQLIAARHELVCRFADDHFERIQRDAAAVLGWEV